MVIKLLKTSDKGKNLKRKIIYIDMKVSKGGSEFLIEHKASKITKGENKRIVSLQILLQMLKG